MSIDKGDLKSLKHDLIYVIEKQKKESLEAIRHETHEAIKTTGHTWIEEAVRKIVPVAVESTMERLGMRPKEPFEMQQDFIWLRKMREEAENKRKTVITATINYLTPAGIAALIAWVVAQK